MNLVWFSEVKWTYLRTRKQHLLSRFPANDKILFIQPFSLRGANSFFPKRDGNVTFVTIPTFRKSKWNWFNQLFEQNWFRFLFFAIIKIWVKLIVQIAMKKVNSWIISNVYYLPVLEKLQGNKIWDLNDDPEQFGEKPNWVMRNFRQFCNDKNHKIIASSQLFSEKIKQEFHRKSIVIPNGVELDLFRKSRNAKTIKKSKIFGYVGVISDWFFDFELVEKMAEKFPDFEIHLIGPKSSGISSQMESIQQLQNVKFFDAVDYDKLPTLLQTFRVGIIPLKNSPKVRQVSSGKFLQYLAAGLPTVSAYFEQYESFSEFVYLSNSHDEFLQNIEKAALDDTESYDELLEKFDWDILSKTFCDEVKNEK